MEEQSYPLSPNYNIGESNMHVPVQVNYCGYYHRRDKANANHRTLHNWYLYLINYRQFPKSDSKLLEERQFVLRRPDTPFPFYLPGNETVGYYWIYFTGNFVEQLLKDCDLEPDRIYTLQEDQMQLLRQRFANLFTEAAKKRFGYQNMVASYLISILVQLGRCIRDDAENVAQQSRKRMEKSFLHIQSVFSDSNLTVAYLAEREGLSESRYRELFRKHFGISPSEAIAQVRIANACHLLQTTNMTISASANYCGYQDIAYFSRLFKLKVGVSPTDYRKGDHNIP